MKMCKCCIYKFSNYILNHFVSLVIIFKMKMDHHSFPHFPHFHIFKFINSPNRNTCSPASMRITTERLLKTQLPIRSLISNTCCYEHLMCGMHFESHAANDTLTKCMQAHIQLPPTVLQMFLSLVKKDHAFVCHRSLFLLPP